MANSVLNEVKFNRRLTEEEKSKLSKLLSTKKQVDFNKLIPQPENLIKVCMSEDTKESYNWYFSKNPDNLSKEELYKCLDSSEKANEILKKYIELYDEEKESIKSDDNYIVLPNWYDWNISNWGTKWNAYESCIYGHEDYDSLCFKTAWSHPKEELIKLLLKKIKEAIGDDTPLEFEAFYLEDMCIYTYEGEQ